MLNFLSETCETCKVRPEKSLLKKSPWLLQDFLNILNFLHDFSRFSFTFPKKTQSSRFSRYLWALCKTGITEPSHYFVIIVRTHLIWIVELETLGYFFVFCHMILGILAQFPWISLCPSTWSAVFGSIFPKFTCCPNTQKTGITQTSGKFCTWLRTD